MNLFKEIIVEENLKELIKMAFNADLNVSGAWGYSKESSTYIEALEESERTQLEFTLATMRAYLEMNMTLDENERYGAINLIELARESQDGYEKVIYEISAIKEMEYKEFIAEYKEQLEDSNFDMSDHFNRRKKATLKREVTHWFKIL